MRVAHEGVICGSWSYAVARYTPGLCAARGALTYAYNVCFSPEIDVYRFDGVPCRQHTRLLRCLPLPLRLPPSPSPPVRLLRQAVPEGPFRFVGASLWDADNDRGAGGVLPRGHAWGYERGRPVGVQPRAACVVSVLAMCLQLRFFPRRGFAFVRCFKEGTVGVCVGR